MRFSQKYGCCWTGEFEPSNFTLPVCLGLRTHASAFVKMTAVKPPCLSLKHTLAALFVFEVVTEPPTLAKRVPAMLQRTCSVGKAQRLCLVLHRCTWDFDQLDGALCLVRFRESNLRSSCML